MFKSALLLPAVLNGVTTGAVYALIALGLTLIYGVLHIINFAHGSLLMLALYGAFFLYLLGGVDPYLALFVLMPAFFALGYGLQRFVIQPASHGRDENILLVTLGLAIVIDNLALWLWTSTTRTIDTKYSFEVVDFGFALVPLPKVIAFFGALAFAGLLWFLIAKTDLGKAIRAVARERDGARLVGIRVEHIYAMTFGIGTAMVAAAACLLLPTFYVTPQVGYAFVLVAFTTVVLGGMGSFAGALIAGLLLGVVEALCGLYLGESLGQIGIFVIFILVLLFRPSGLFGAAIGGVIGLLVFRYRLRGAYFALVTLAFAEVARVLVASFEYTGSGFGMLIPLSRGAANFQFADRRIFYFIAWGLVAIGCVIAWWIENSRFGARLMAIRENEDAAQALGIDLVRTKVLTLTLSAAMAAAVGVFYVQNYLFVDSHLAFGPSMSIEALLVCIVGGLGTIFGPLFGAIALHTLGEAAKQVTGNAPGLNLVLYGVLLILALCFLPNGVSGLFARRMRRKQEPANA
jgi:branched-chain amino acid transport system permease protein